MGNVFNKGNRNYEDFKEWILESMQGESPKVDGSVFGGMA